MNILEQRLEDLIKHYIESYTLIFPTLDSFFSSLTSLLYLKSGINLSEINDRLDGILLRQLNKYLYEYNSCYIFQTCNQIKRSSIFSLHDYIKNAELNDFFNDLKQEIYLYYKEIHNIIFK